MASQKTKEILRRSYIACISALQAEQCKVISVYNTRIEFLARELDKLDLNDHKPKHSPAPRRG